MKRTGWELVPLGRLVLEGFTQAKEPSTGLVPRRAWPPERTELLKAWPKVMAEAVGLLKMVGVALVTTKVLERVREL